MAIKISTQSRYTVQVRNLKSLSPDNGSRQPRPPHEVQASIQEQVLSWISDGSYLHDTVANSVRVRPPLFYIPLTYLQTEQIHFGHPIIASTCRSFYFDRWIDISECNPNLFQGSVPKPLVALVGTVVCCLIISLLYIILNMTVTITTCLMSGQGGLCLRSNLRQSTIPRFTIPSSAASKL